MRILFAESDFFSRKFAQAATDAEYQALQRELAENPEKGDVIQGAGGARKVRKEEKKEIAAYIRNLKGT